MPPGGKSENADPAVTGSGSETEPPSHEGSEAQERASDAPVDPVAALTAEKETLYQQLLRTAADFDNFRKRARRDQEEAERRAADHMLLEFLPVMDNLERAAAAASNATDVKSVAEGVAMVLRQFEELRGRMGLERVPTVGEHFDPNLHDAVQQRETDDFPPGSVVAEIVPGYKRHQRLLRAALVVVARPPARNNSAEESSP